MATARRIGVANPSGDDDSDLDGPPELVSAAVKADLDAIMFGEMAQKPDVEYLVDGRPGMSVRYRTSDLTSEKIKLWRKRNTRRKVGRDDEFDELRFACTICAGQSVAILFKGVELTDDDGDSTTMRSPRLKERYGVLTNQEVALALVGDPDVLKHANNIVNAAGFGDLEVQDEDPTIGAL